MSASIRRPRTVTIAMPVAGKVCTLNHRMHWRVEAKWKKAWRDAAQIAGCALGAPSKRRLEGRWFLWCSYPVAALGIRRDPHNWTLTDKWIIDGLVLAGVLPDDDRTHVVHGDATFHAARSNPNVIVMLTDDLASMGATA